MTDWSAQAERGKPWLLNTMAWIVRNIGWRAGWLLLPGITAFFYIRSAPHRAASRSYLTRALGREATGRDVFRHIFTFAGAIMERVFLLSGRTEAFTFEIEGLEHMDAIAASGQGCVLMGAHFGSFEALRHLRTLCPVPVKALMYKENAGPLTRVLEAIDPTLAGSIIEIGDTGSMLRVQEAVAAGAFVGMLADRSPDGARAIPVAFFGRVAHFPTGPLVVAATLQCPVVTFRGVRLGPRRYRIAFSPFADRITLPRATRQAELARYVQLYAAWLEAGCRAHPFNWFNFYPFWEIPVHAPTQARAAAAPGRAVAAAVERGVPAR